MVFYTYKIDNNIGNKGLKKLKKSLCNINNISIFYINGNRLGNESINEICEILKNMSKIKILSLYGINTVI